MFSTLSTWKSTDSISVIGVSPTFGLSYGSACVRVKSWLPIAVELARRDEVMEIWKTAWSSGHQPVSSEATALVNEDSAKRLTQFLLKEDQDVSPSMVEWQESAAVHAMVPNLLCSEKLGCLSAVAERVTKKTISPIVDWAFNRCCKPGFWVYEICVTTGKERRNILSEEELTSLADNDIEQDLLDASLPELGSEGLVRINYCSDSEVTESEILKSYLKARSAAEASGKTLRKLPLSVLEKHRPKPSDKDGSSSSDNTLDNLLTALNESLLISSSKAKCVKYDSDTIRVVLSKESPLSREISSVSVKRSEFGDHKFDAVLLDQTGEPFSSDDGDFDTFLLESAAEDIIQFCGMILLGFKVLGAGEKRQKENPSGFMKCLESSLVKCIKKSQICCCTDVSVFASKKWVLMVEQRITDEKSSYLIVSEDVFGRFYDSAIESAVFPEMTFVLGRYRQGLLSSVSLCLSLGSKLFNLTALMRAFGVEVELREFTPDCSRAAVVIAVMSVIFPVLRPHREEEELHQREEDNVVKELRANNVDISYLSGRVSLSKIAVINCLDTKVTVDVLIDARRLKRKVLETSAWGSPVRKLLSQRTSEIRSTPELLAMIRSSQMNVTAEQLMLPRKDLTLLLSSGKTTWVGQTGVLPLESSDLEMAISARSSLGKISEEESRRMVDDVKALEKKSCLAILGLK